MTSSAKVAIVTGSNKGIGFAIVRGLCKQFNGHVYLTARNETLGKEAVASLEREGLKPHFHQLDITDECSVERLAQHIKQTYGGLDILVNNAGFAYKNSATEPFGEQAEETLKINYWGTLTVCKHFFPLLRSHARVVHLSSFASLMAMNKCSAELQQKLRALTTVEDLNKYMSEFVKLAQEGKHTDHGWPNTAYGVSKLGETLVAPIQQSIIEQDKTRTDIIINAVCPGFVDTDMTSHKGHKTIDEGADTPLYAALLPPDTAEPRGKFMSERKVQAV